MAIVSVTGIEANQKIAAFDEVPVEVKATGEDISLIKIEVKIGATVMSTVFSPLLATDTAFFNLRQSLTSLLFDYNEITSTPSKQNQSVNITITEILTKTGTPDTTTINNIIIYKALDINLEAWDDGVMSFVAISKEHIADRYVILGQDVYISFYTANNENSIWDMDNYEEIETGISLHNEFGCSSKISLTKKPNPIFLVAWNGFNQGSNGVRINLIEKKYPRKKMLYWLNEFGGWDFYPFIDYEETEKTNKNQYTKFSDMYGNTEVYQYIENKHRRLKLYGLPGVAEKIGFLKGLLSSPIVLDEDNKKVRVISDRIKWDQSGIIEPEINIEYIDEQVINF